MSVNQTSYEQRSLQLHQHDLQVELAELQGILCGMLAGGMNVDDHNWLDVVKDTVNSGEPLSKGAKEIVVQVYNEICQQYIEPDFALEIYLPDDASPINDRGRALTLWVQGFLLGFGLHQNSLDNVSEEVKEALQDFSQIAQMDEEMDEGEENEQALFEVQEYVRISAMLCFNELGKSLLNTRNNNGSSVIH